MKTSTTASRQRLQQVNDTILSPLSPTNKGQDKSFHPEMKWCPDQHLEDGTFDSRICQYSKLGQKTLADL